MLLKNICFFSSYLGSLNISRVSLKGVESAISKHMDEKTEYKGVKAHFKMDENGILNLEEVCIVISYIKLLYYIYYYFFNNIRIK